MIPGPFPGPPRHVKRRDRSGTNPYTHAPHMPGVFDNGRMPSGEHPRHLSGASLNGGTAHWYAPPMPSMFNPFPPGARLPSNTSVMSPPMHPHQMEHMQMIPRVAMFPPPGAIPPQLHDPAYQSYLPTPFMDMSNSLQQPQVRHPDAHGMQRSSSQSAKTAGLFNPYGAERPDKAGFTTTCARKGSRGNYPNNAGRGRKYSAGTFDRSFYGQYPSDPPGHGMRGGSSQFGEGPQVHLLSKTFEADPNIVEDKQFGCSHDFIGPKNNTVRMLYVKNLPKEIQLPELGAVFLDSTGVTPESVQIKNHLEFNDFTQAFISFKSVDEARLAFEAVNAKGLKFRDREAQVSVARRYFQFPTSSQQPRIASHEFRRPIDSNVAPVKPIHYSPQDARSDLHRSNRPQQPDHPATRGSPEARKAKKNVLVKKNLATREDHQTRATEATHPSSDISLNLEVEDSTRQDEPSSWDKQDDANSSAVITMPMIEIARRTPEEEPGNASKGVATNREEAAPATVVKGEPVLAISRDTITEGDVAAKPGLQQGPSLSPENAHTIPEYDCESIIAECQGTLPGSPTKSIPPLSTDRLDGSVEGSNGASSPAGDMPVQYIAATPSGNEESPSDDDQKNDFSFHSARESQLDGDDDVRKGSGASAANLKTDLDCQTTHDEAHDAVQHHEVAGLEACEELNEPELSTAVSQEPRNKDIPTASELYHSLNQTAKKQGIKQVESLNPYSKTFRALQKKEKQAKKKEKRKKSKVEATTKTETYAEDTSTDDKGFVQDLNGTKTDLMHEVVDDDSGQQSGQVSHIATKQILEAQQHVDAQESEVALGRAGSPPIVQSHEKDDAHPNGAEVGASSIELATRQEASCQGQEPETMSKKGPSRVAVPHLSLVSPAVPSARGATPPNTAYFSLTSPTSEKSDVIEAGDEVAHKPGLGQGKCSPHGV